MIGDGRLEAAAARIARLLVERRETVAVSESSAGGLVSAALLSVPGASAYYLGGAVVYTVRARDALLGIGPDDMQGIRSASEPWAALMAKTIRTSHRATWGLAETGATGPTGNRYGDPAGHACLAVDGPKAKAITLRTGSDDRSANMLAFALATLELLEEALEERI
ncbi:CinA family protein [Phreatobacter sp.]|uniref:CinA family protein n=1 Tax=Phreatobacter sp. TaxID=1966341 RepID=UPI003F71FD6F